MEPTIVWLRINQKMLDELDEWMIDRKPKTRSLAMIRIRNRRMFG